MRTIGPRTQEVPQRFLLRMVIHHFLIQLLWLLGVSITLQPNIKLVCIAQCMLQAIVVSGRIVRTSTILDMSLQRRLVRILGTMEFRWPIGARFPIPRLWDISHTYKKQ